MELLLRRDKMYSVPHVAISLLRKVKGRAMEYEVVDGNTAL